MHEYDVIVCGAGSAGFCASVAAARQGKKVAILDADITGPSIPKAFGITEKAMGNGEMIMPVETLLGIKVMSINLLLENDTDPVVWRGPVVGGVVEQFWSDVCWGDIDVMFVDMPPGTGDVALTVYQSLPVDGIIIVTSPQELVSMIVEKAVKMTAMLNLPVIGLVENMSYFKCPDCGSNHYIYGKSVINAVAAKYGIEIVEKLPIDPAIAQAVDNGEVYNVDGKYVSELCDFIKVAL
jgi:Mrp family chromosome partitioning ATPase